MKMDANIKEALMGVIKSSREIIKNDQRHLFTNVSRFTFKVFNLRFPEWRIVIYFYVAFVQKLWLKFYLVDHNFDKIELGKTI